MEGVDRSKVSDGKKKFDGPMGEFVEVGGERQKRLF